MSDVDADLKTLLREKADEVRSDPRIPGPLLRRARRRRLFTGVAAGAVAVGAVAALVVGGRFLVQETAEPRQIRPAGTRAEFYPFIYPPNQTELATTLAEVVQGSMPMWTDPEGAAALFAVNVMGWDPNDVEASVRGDDPITVAITNPALNEAAGADADIRTQVYLSPVPGQTDPPMYAVLAAQAEDMNVEPVGPDQEFGANGVVAFRGRVGFVPPEGSVLLTLEGDEGSAVGASTVIQPDGRFEIEAQLPHPLRPSTFVSLVLADGSGRTLATTSSRLATPLAGEPDASFSELEPALPSPVAQTRDAILDAAQARDFEALRTLIPDEGFTFSFGGDRDPIAYWKRLESQAHVPVIGDILPMVLGTVPARQHGTYIWPAPAAEDPADWDQADLKVLHQIHPEEDIRLFQEIGLYTGWRVGIDRDGTWVFFVSGD